MSCLEENAKYFEKTMFIWNIFLLKDFLIITFIYNFAKTSGHVSEE